MMYPERFKTHHYTPMAVCLPPLPLHKTLHFELLKVKLNGLLLLHGLMGGSINTFQRFQVGPDPKMLGTAGLNLLL